LATLAVAHDQHSAIEVDVLDAQGEGLLQPEAAAVHEGRDQLGAASQMIEYGPDLGSRQDQRHPHGAFGARGVLEVIELSVEHLPEQEEEGAEGLVLGGAVDPTADGQVSEVGPDLDHAEVLCVAGAVERQEAVYPRRVRLLGAEAVATLM